MPPLPESRTGLYWSIRGGVLCAYHARDLNDETWYSDAWTPLPESSQGTTPRYQCQRCSPDGTALASRKIFGA